jgi:hypothetical protein
MSESPFDSTRALAPLKSFQRATVDHVCRRLFTDPDPVRRFLVADEVGLGKTLVARGVIARTIEALWHDVPRIDIIYVCSNGAIARQNLRKLNVMEGEAQSLPTRLTLLPLHLGMAGGLRGKKVNFVSLTPNTAFKLTDGSGSMEERALLLRLMANLELPETGAINLFQAYAGTKGWRGAREAMASRGIDANLADAFRTKLDQSPNLIASLRHLCERFADSPNSPDELARRGRESMIGELRSLLAAECVSALEPDLIILDEFQRFDDLLHGETEASALAQALFDYRSPDGHAARTLLLSATPYRMMTLSGDSESEGDHYSEFLNVVAFLFGRKNGKAVAGDLAKEMQRFRQAMQALPGSLDFALTVKSRIETLLRGVMARTERVADTADREAMLQDVPSDIALYPDDLREARAIAEVAKALGAPGTVEYWKSVPYLLSFLRDYKLRKLLDVQGSAPSPALCAAIRGSYPFQLRKDQVQGYAEIPLNNGRMRTLRDRAFEGGLARKLWLPPSLPYQGERVAATKSLVFSSWSMVPDAIATLLSYEADREIGMADSGQDYFDRKTTRPLQFRVADGRLAGLRALLLIYPSPMLAAAADPLAILTQFGGTPTEGEMRIEMAKRLRPMAEAIVAASRPEGEASNWDWAGPAFLDRRDHSGTVDWLASADGMAQCGAEEGWSHHVTALSELTDHDHLSGHADVDTVTDHLVTLAMGSPAICALRALSRIAPSLPLDDPGILSAAARIGMGFRTLFNQPETQHLLRAEDDTVYWRAVLQYAGQYDLQAVLDEYVHVLFEAEGLNGHAPREVVARLAEVMVDALSLRPAQVEVDQIRVRRGRLETERMTMRGRFAMRLADSGETEAGEKRTGLVRIAFNSPFRPFVLATTSVGQEGLDFHPYCHRLFHWNLPSNPVDLEQREGRVHRYKSHAIRLNVANGYAADLAKTTLHVGDPWWVMFEAAREAASGDADLEPYWLCEGPTKVERHVLSLPYSREVSRLGWLKRSVAIYRLAFGQPRQDDLLSVLTDIQARLGPDILAALQISLRPNGGDRKDLVR